MDSGQIQLASVNVNNHQIYCRNKKKKYQAKCISGEGEHIQEQKHTGQPFVQYVMCTTCGFIIDQIKPPFLLRIIGMSHMQPFPRIITHFAFASSLCSLP